MTEWVNRELFPFAVHEFDLPDGTLRYVDEGDGPVVLMVHGTPTWSFLYRHLIAGLRDSCRVIAPDNLGFGLSDKPAGIDYRPAAQSRRLCAFIDALNLRDITLVVHDFGGPIGLPYAIENPNNVKRLVLFNTWLWSLKDARDKVMIGQILGSPFGRLLYERFNFSANVIMPGAYGDRSALTPEIHDHYRWPFPNISSRQGAWIYARELLQSGPWYDAQWEKRGVLQPIPALLLWGMKDPAFGETYLQRWQSIFEYAETHTLPETGHFVQEEQGANLVPLIQDFIFA